MTRQSLASGILMWDGSERRSNRYGAIYAADKNFNGDVPVFPTFNEDIAKSLLGKRVRLTVKVLEARESGHCGDLFLSIFPSQPEVGEEIDLGVGVFQHGTSYDGTPSIVLHPGLDNYRDELWIDPRKLYRLHDQTVEIFIEETTDDFTPTPLLERGIEGAVSLGDGYVQTKGGTSLSDLRNDVEHLGEGLFMVTAPGHGPKGSHIKVKKS